MDAWHGVGEQTVLRILILEQALVAAGWTAVEERSPDLAAVTGDRAAVLFVSNFAH